MRMLCSGTTTSRDVNDEELFSTVAPGQTKLRERERERESGRWSDSEAFLPDQCIMFIVFLAKFAV